MKQMRKLMDRRTFSVNVALRHAQKIYALSHGIPRLFPPGTDMLPSEARPDVWQRRAEFEELAGMLEAETRKLVFATESGLRPQIRAQYAAVIKRCGACHQGFRKF
jgi:cytochrome c556